MDIPKSRGLEREGSSHSFGRCLWEIKPSQRLNNIYLKFFSQIPVDKMTPGLCAQHLLLLHAEMGQAQSKDPEGSRLQGAVGGWWWTRQTQERGMEKRHRRREGLGDDEERRPREAAGKGRLEQQLSAYSSP